MTNLTIERLYIESMISAFPELAPLTEQLRFGDRADVSIRSLSSEALEMLETLYRNAGP